MEYDFGDWNLFGEYTKLDTDVDDLTIDAISLGRQVRVSALMPVGVSTFS
ncbi:MAG: hypothetical protein M5U09_25070 [Gammaproteobacteria bacterium]|nr:hypothetical protein [Gammaproteobacteria bacterium]